MTLNPFSISGLILSLTCLVLIYIILKSATSRIHHIWALFNIAVAVWGIGSFFLMKQGDFGFVLFWLRVAHAGVIFIAVFFFHLVYLVSESKKQILLIGCYIFGAVFFALNFTDFFVNPKNVVLMYNSFYFDRSKGALIPFFFVTWFAIICYGHYELFRYYLRASGLRRNQILYFFVALIVGFSGGITNFFPTFNIPFYPIGNFTIPIYCIIVTYAILKYRLLDIKIAVTRTGLFIVVYTLILGLPFIIAKNYKSFLVGIFPDEWWLFPLGLMALLATLGPFFFIFINKKAESRLLGEQRSYQNILRSASGGMIRVKDLNRLLSLIVRVVTKTVKIKSASVYLYNKENESFTLHAARGGKDFICHGLDIHRSSPVVLYLMKKRESIITEEIFFRLNDDPANEMLVRLAHQLRALKTALVIPSLVEDRLIGILLLGDKLSGKLYSTDDLNIFSVLANQAALAIENAQFYDEIKQTHEQLFQAEKLATIGTMADGLSHQINNRFHALSLISGDSLDILKTLDTSHCDQGIVSAINDVKSGLERIQANVLQGGEVVKGLLKYSRPGEAGFEPVYLRDVISGAVDMVQYKIRLKEIDFFENIPEDLPKLRGNLTQLQEVFFNMFDNAYDAIKERQASLKEEGYKGKIEVVASLDDGNLKVVVSDTGMGVKDKDKKNLFTPFFTTKATARKGTGLGLYVIEKIVAAHNGKLSMDSTYQSGTIFTVILPLAGPRQA